MSSVLVLLLLGEVWLMIRAGSQFYRKARAQSEMQKNALLALRWLSKDLSEAAPLSFRFYDPENPAVPTVRQGIVFGSPKDLEEKVHYNENGRLLWTSMVAYYIDPESKALYRKKLELEEDERGSRAPQINDDKYHVDLMAERSPAGRIVARDLYKLRAVPGPKNIKIDIQCRSEELGYGISVSTRLEMKNK